MLFSNGTILSSKIVKRGRTAKFFFFLTLFILERKVKYGK